MSFFFDLPALFVIGGSLCLLGKHFELKRLTKIILGLLIISCFMIFSVMLYFDAFNFNFPAIGFNMTGSQFMFRWPLPISWFTKEFVPSLFVIILFLLYPVSFYLGYAFTLLISKKHKRMISKDLKSYNDIKSRKNLPKDMKFSIVRYSFDKNGISSLQDAVEGTIREMGGIDKFVKKNERVLIKVNICGGIPDNPATYTSKDVVGHVVDLIAKEVGGNTIIICDADMIWTKFSENASAMGWNDWVEKKNLDLKEINNENPGFLSEVKLVNLSQTELTYFDFGRDSVFQLLEDRPNQEIVSAEMLKADVIISIPKMKTHLLTGVTLGMKNMYGTFPDEDKARYHLIGINEVIYWVNYAFPPNLTIIDGTIGGEAIGPLSSNPIPYNTIISSESVAIADAVASKLMGYNDPFDSIEHLELTRKEELSRPRDQMVLLSGIIPPELEQSATNLIRDRHLPENSKDGNWERPDPKVAENYEYLMENILAIPGIDTFFNIGADFFLFDLARIPLLKYFNVAILQFLCEAPRFWATKTTETNLTTRDRRINLVVFSLIIVLSLYFFVNNGYMAASLPQFEKSQWIIMSFALAIVLGYGFVINMKAKNLIGITLASMAVALFVESFAPSAHWWTYHHENVSLYAAFPYTSYIFSNYKPPNMPYYPLFSVPIFIITIIGISYFIFKPIFTYVDLKGERFKMVPFEVIMILLISLLYLEGYLNEPGSKAVDLMIIIYLLLGVLGLYYNLEQKLDWNLSIAITAVMLGVTMEYLGAKAEFWGYPQTWHSMTPLDSFAWLDATKFQSFTRLPIFVSLTWALNIWAACGLARIFGIDMSKAYPLTEKMAEEKKEELAKRKNKADLEDIAEMAQESVESIFGINAGIIWKALNKNGPMTISDLVKATALQPEEIYSALGWLGREDKISVVTCGNIRSFSLRP
jgi:uncharacterized protein (DUF362 family)